MTPIKITLPGSGREFKVRTSHDPIEISGMRYLRQDEAMILKHLPAKLPKKILIPYGANAPLLPSVIASLAPDSEINIFDFELHRTRNGSIKMEQFTNLNFICEPDLPEDIEAGLVLYAPDEKSDRMLFYDMVERMNMILPVGTQVLFGLPASRAQDCIRKIQKDMKGMNVLEKNRSGRVCSAITTGLQNWTPRVATYEADTVDNVLELVSRPGCFCHGRMDSGGAALSEMVKLELSEERVLDLGCGTGLVGLKIAKKMQDAGVEGEVVLVDSNIRAVACCAHNAELNGLDNVRVVASDVYDPEGEFSLVVGNPPYYADHRIAEYFAQTAAAATTKGGRLYLISKKAEAMEQSMRAFAFSAESSNRRNYAVTYGIKTI